MNNLRAVNFTIALMHGVVVITDDFNPKRPSRTVTNAAEELISWLCNANVLTPGRRVIYRDTEGTWDEIVHEDGQFVRFAPIQTKCFDLAMLTVCDASRA